jgi:hypothetical protein
LYVFQTERAREKFFLFANRVDIAKIESARAICLRSACVSQDTHSSFICRDQTPTAAIGALSETTAADSAACGVDSRYSFCEMPA